MGLSLGITNAQIEALEKLTEMGFDAILIDSYVSREKKIFGLECDRIDFDEVRVILNKPEIGVYGPQNRSRGKGKVRRWR